ncbi:MAG: cache domain-containing protein [Rubrivivax sp.]|nr:cache domain-containing protein [Rubrivivax sp.]
MPMALVLPLLGVTLWIWIDDAFDRLLITKVRSDLAVAHGYFDRTLAEVGASATAVADSQALHTALAAADPARTEALLKRFRERERLDFTLLGRPGQAAIDATDLTSVEILEGPALALLEAPLRERVGVAIVPTRNAAPTQRQREDRAMVLLATRVVRDEVGRPIAQLQAGVLLNRNLPFIDHVNAIVYPDGSLPYGSRGTATLFLDDVRISTNVRLFGAEQEQRAIGTRVSASVRQEVLDAGRTWLGRAFVVNDWYVSGYEPVIDGSGRRVGMLYVGFTEAPFTGLKYTALAALSLLFVAAMAGAAWLCLRGARTVASPLERMATTMQRVGGGDRSARVGDGHAGSDEIGQLAGHLDELLDKVDGHARALEEHNAQLDAKVAERTRDLEAAQSQLVHSEKLAAVGQLTASIAHEINNPIAVIQGNLDLVRETLGPAAAPVRAELKIADEQVERMRLIVTQLLQFARPREYAGYVEAVDVTALVDASLLLAGHLLARSQIEVVRELRATHRPAINRNELQQVLVNLLVNAIHAMEGGGTLTLASRDVGEAGVEITVTDTGPGLGAELLAELFKPFVTRKKDGTGLGLWISRTIVERYEGELRAADREDGTAGAVFTIRLSGES